jgi:hypothetical protein
MKPSDCLGVVGKCTDCENPVLEYLHKSPLTYSSPLTSLTPQQTIPCNPGITLIPGTPKTNPGTYPDIYCGVKVDA